MVSQISEAVLDGIADALVDKGYILLSDIIPDYVSLALLEKMQAEQNINFKKAAIGRGIANKSILIFAQIKYPGLTIKIIPTVNIYQ